MNRILCRAGFADTLQARNTAFNYAAVFTRRGFRLGRFEIPGVIEAIGTNLERRGITQPALVTFLLVLEAESELRDVGEFQPEGKSEIGCQRCFVRYQVAGPEIGRRRWPH